MGRFTDRLSQPSAEPWMSKVNDELEGIVATTEWREGAYGRYPAITVEGVWTHAATKTEPAREEQGRFMWHAFHSQARSLLKQLKPKPGDSVGFKYLGLADGKSGRQYEKYTGAIEKPDGTPTGIDWDASSKQADEFRDDEPPDDAGFDDEPF